MKALAGGKDGFVYLSRVLTVLLQTLLQDQIAEVGYYTVISCMFVVYSKLLPRGAMDDLMHYCTSASCNSASGRPRHLRVIV